MALGVKWRKRNNIDLYELSSMLPDYETKKYIAEKLSLTTRTINNYLTGVRTPSPEMYEKIKYLHSRYANSIISA